MKKPVKPNLPTDIEALQKLVLDQRARITLLEELVILFRGKQFGKSSEKCSQQAELFDESEREADEQAPTIAEPIIDETERDLAKPQSKPGRKPLPADLPRVRIEHDIAEHDKTCTCGCQKVCIGEETSEQLDIIPAVVQVIVHARKKYACQACEDTPVTAPKPAQPIPKSNASPGLLAHIAVAKYQDGLPLYRMETIFHRLGIHLPRNTQANWMIKCSELLQPLYNLMNDHLLGSGYIHMDETRVQVLNEPDKPPDSQSYMWVRKTGDAGKPVILFDYAPSRRAQVVTSLLGDYQGYLQTDDYAGYHAMGKKAEITHLGCWAHARRYFMDAIKAAPAQKGKMSKADMALQMIGKLYAIEKQIKERHPDEKYQYRQTHSAPQLEKLKAWLDKALQKTLPKGKTGEALAYLHKNWDRLTVYVDDGRLAIDNNPVENAIRPFAIGRKNWLFSSSQAGAKASAMLYSIIETAKANDLEPYTYLRTLLTRLPACETVADFEQLLPWHVDLEPLPHW